MILELGERGVHIPTRALYRYSLARQPLLPKEGERVWSNAYRARVPAHCIVRANQMHGIESHDCAGMKGMQINDCARARSCPSTVEC